ncbi:MAG: ABC transporter ATP-binding protein [Candidatus Rokubacteria bacterium]|nr:ABC transporter ATP-binding protein [Candidatus Rokubacteria bacterium]
MSKVFRTVEDNATFTALHDINLRVAGREFLVVVGRSGCGKTTLLRLIAGLERPSKGEIWLRSLRVPAPGDGSGVAAGEELRFPGLPEIDPQSFMGALGPRRLKVTGPGPDRGMVFQEHLLFPWLTVKGNVGFGLRNKGLSKRELEHVVGELLMLVGLERFAKNYPKELSGGMRQRAGIARALAADPEILLMDEPFGSVDVQTRATLQGELLNIWDRTGKTIVFVTHSVEEAVFLADRIVVLHSNPGRLAAMIPVELPRPRKRTSPEFNALESQVLDLLDEGPN